MVILKTQSATSNGLLLRIIFFAEIVYFFIDYQSEKFNLQSKHMQEFNQQKNEQPGFLALPSWSEEMETVFQIIKNSFPELSKPIFTYISQKDSLRAKIECVLDSNNTLVISCLGKNELTMTLVFKIFVSTMGKDFQFHRFDQNLQIPLSDNKNPYEGVLLTKTGPILNDILGQFYKNTDLKTE